MEAIRLVFVWLCNLIQLRQTICHASSLVHTHRRQQSEVSILTKVGAEPIQASVPANMPHAVSVQVDTDLVRFSKVIFSFMYALSHSTTSL